MRASSFWREVGRNLATGTTRAVTFGLCLALIVGALCVAELGTVREILNSEQRYRASGADVTVLTANGRIDGNACDELIAAPGVIAAGAIRETRTRLTPTVLPDAPIPVSEVSPGFRDLVRAPSRSGLSLGPEAQDVLGARPGSRLATATGAVAVAGSYSYPDDGRRGGLRYAALSPSASSAPYDECWVREWPQSDDVNSLLLLSMIPEARQEPSASADAARGSATPDPPSFSQLNSTLGTRFAGRALFDARVTKWSPLIAALAGMALGSLSIRMRRLQFASALHAGVRRSDQVLFALTETSAWILGGLIIGFPVVALSATSTAFPNSPALLALGGAIMLAAALGGTLGGVLAAGSTREKHLFRYFKDR